MRNLRSVMILVLVVTVIGFLCIGQSASAGSLAAWGNNDDGQCDFPDGNDFVAIAAGGKHSLALKSNGSLAAWGNNDDGQCSDIPGGADQSNGWWVSRDCNFVDIAAGENHSLALKSNGSLAAWGYNYYGQCDVPEGNDFVDIAAGKNHSLALKSNSSLAAWGCNCWGCTDYGQCSVPEGNDFVDIAAGENHSLALKSNRSIVGWGYNKHGQTNVPDGNNFVAIAAGRYHSLALNADQRIIGWGTNWYGVIANVPDNNDFVAIATGSLHNLALKSDGSIAAWGYNGDHQCSDIPDGANEVNEVWYSKAINFVLIAGGDKHSLAIRGKRPDGFTLIDPNGGETLITGNTYTINWVGPNTISQVLIDYSADNGDSWTPVAPPNWGNTGRYNWLVPSVTSEQCQLASKECLVRISAVGNLTICGTSANVFIIYECRLPEVVRQEGDLNHDCYVNGVDLEIFLGHWLKCGNPFDDRCDGEPNCVDP